MFLAYGGSDSSKDGIYFDRYAGVYDSSGAIIDVPEAYLYPQTVSTVHMNALALCLITGGTSA